MIESYHPLFGLGLLKIQTLLGILTDIFGLSLLIIIVLALFYRVTGKHKSPFHKKIILSLLGILIITKGMNVLMEHTGCNTLLYTPTIHGQLHLQKIDYPNKNSLLMSLQFTPDDPATFLIAGNRRDSLFILMKYYYLKLKYSQAFQKLSPNEQVIGTISITCNNTIQRDKLKNIFTNKGLLENTTIPNSNLKFKDSCNYNVSYIQIDTIDSALPKENQCRTSLN